MKIEVIPALLPLYTTDKRFIVVYGGRASGKSWAVADFLIAKSLEASKRMLCTREYQSSIRDSSHKLIADRIKHHNLESLFEITEHSIRNTVGSEFIFRGLYRNEQSIRSLEGVDFCWSEESQSVSRESNDALVPTIRKQGSQIIYSMNPNKMTDAVYSDFIIPDREDTLKIKVNYYDNPFLSDEIKQQIEHDKKTNLDRYNHVWEGHCVSHSDAQVFKGKWLVEEFTTDNSFSHYYGADWGFANDPSALVHLAIKDRTLYVEHEVVQVGVEIDKLPAMFKTIPNSDKFTIVADSSRPETISYMRRNGFPKMKSSIKGKNSVVEGIEFIKSFDRIVIHTRCKTSASEFMNYSYKTDKYSGQILDEPEDCNNHIIDSIRYATEDIRRNRQISQIKISGW